MKTFSLLFLLVLPTLVLAQTVSHQSDTSRLVVTEIGQAFSLGTGMAPSTLLYRDSATNLSWAFTRAEWMQGNSGTVYSSNSPSNPYEFKTRSGFLRGDYPLQAADICHPFIASRFRRIGPRFETSAARLPTSEELKTYFKDQGIVPGSATEQLPYWTSEVNPSDSREELVVFENGEVKSLPKHGQLALLLCIVELRAR
jgi:hypothetical protein